MKLHSYQTSAVQRALAAPGRRWVFNDETGLGKSCQALEACKRLGARKIIVVCPAMVRSNWKREFAKWWPDGPAPSIIWAGGERKGLSKVKAADLKKAYQSDVIVVSYSLLRQLKNARGSLFTPDVIIFDEAHLIQKPSSGWSRDCRDLVRRAPSAAVFALTATMMPNQPSDVWTLLDTLCPERFGRTVGQQFSEKVPFKFLSRYALGTHNGYGWAWKGYAPDTAAEFRFRLQEMSSRTTKQSVAHLLPPFTVRQMTGSGDVLNDALSWLDDALSEASHACILTHLRATTREIAAVLQEKYPGHPIVALTGAESATERDERIEALKEEPRGILVATMHSVGRGIDLTRFTRALFAELYWRPETLVQALGRFSRLSGSVPSLVDLLVVPGAKSDKIASVLVDKLDAINELTNASQSEELLSKALGMSDEQLVTALRAAAAQQDESVDGLYSLTQEDEDDNE